MGRVVEEKIVQFATLLHHLGCVVNLKLHAGEGVVACIFIESEHGKTVAGLGKPSIGSRFVEPLAGSWVAEGVEKRSTRALVDGGTNNEMFAQVCVDTGTNAITRAADGQKGGIWSEVDNPVEDVWEEGGVDRGRRRGARCGGG